MPKKHKKVRVRRAMKIRTETRVINVNPNALRRKYDELEAWHDLDLED
jgi:hypothetical protein